MKKKIGEILIANGLIDKKVLDEALAHQKRCGGNITQYLIAQGYLKEEDLAKCISVQFGYPYLPLRAYDIPADIVKLVPAAIVKKFWLMPIDKIQNIITLVMADPFDEEALNEVEKATGCKVQPFVGILSDILKAIEKYYGINVGYEELKKDREAAPLFIAKEKYTGVERRRSLRIHAKIAVHFPLQNEYKESYIKDVSMHGLFFESTNMLPIGSVLEMKIELPKNISPHPIPVVAKVTRTAELPNKSFGVGVEIIRVATEDLEKITNYASSQQNVRT
ncbi:MAG: PilZ domain-containing protein [Candidatus Omnitrophica bacterium]|nr:PilZ domain-containing protein [Candidatus Omnitrophota bacterium]